MPWKRRGDTVYYYRSVRVGSRVRSVYKGGGEIGELFAEISEVNRTTRRKLREADLLDVEHFQDEQRELGFDSFHRRVENLARAALEAAGYRRHKRSEWRKRRMPRVNASNTELALASPSASAGEHKGGQDFSLAVAASSAATEETRNRQALTDFVTLPEDEFQQRIGLAKEGDLETLDWMYRVFLTDPVGKLAELYGASAAKQIERILVHRIAGDDQVARTSLLAQVERMRMDLSGPEPSALERVLANRVALAWLTLHSLELQYERETHNLGPALAETMERRIARTNRQFNEACKTLAIVRRLAVPAIRMFVAERQVNILGESTTAS
ncbi:hypothetical protein SAMN05444166_0208 [Singulisphaera sp. GP187]|uniref:hypothetical protein n=1 Tax=Singulisphaera sp. GP187 TaxID=1882752 RepID=UPI0009265CD5|nr:hypothetical protein [Singulisphaera sp. GP187]SIN69812.1 hypothetical protein SAMN05444166_0208 [Singulisphaera sp. GP187]